MAWPLRGRQGTLGRHPVSSSTAAYVAVGAAAAEAIARVRADIYFMGATGVHPEMGLTTGDAEEAAIKRMLCRHAAETVVLASREKLGAVCSYAVVPLPEVGMLVVEGGLPRELMQPYRQLGLHVVAA